MPRPDNWPRTILHVDLDAFYTSVHQRDDPTLRGIPVAVAGRSKRAVVMGASYEARAFGVRSAMPLHEALKVCPQLMVVTPDGARYRDASRAVHQIFRRFTSPELVEGIALDEAYLDVTARTRHGTSNGEDVARRIKFQVHTEVGLTASVGGATSKLVAKVASGTHKPDGLYLVPPGAEASFLAPLPINVIPGLGPKTEERLTAMGVRTVGELATYETQRLVQALGVGGAVLQRFAQGRDRAPVDGSKPAKTISAETTFEEDVSDRAQLEKALRDLTDRVVERLKAEDVRARTIYVKLKLPDFKLVSRQVSRTSPTDDVETIFRAARSALEKSHVESRPARLIGKADGVAEPVQRAHPRVATPGEDELGGAAHADQLVIDQVGRHPDEGEPPLALADDLVAGRMGDEMGEPLHGDRVAVGDGLGHRLRER